MRMRREARLMARLGDHPHIVTVYDVFEDAGELHIVVRYMAGGSLAARLAAAPGGRLELGEVLRIGRALADALAHAHDHGVDPPRRQARQRLAGRRRERRTRRLRHRRSGGRCRQDGFRGHGHAVLPGARAGRGRGAAAAERPLRARRDAVGAALRAASVPGRRRAGRARPAPGRRAGAAVAARRRRAAGARRARARAAREARRRSGRRRRRTCATRSTGSAARPACPWWPWPPTASR